MDSIKKELRRLEKGPKVYIYIKSNTQPGHDGVHKFWF